MYFLFYILYVCCVLVSINPLDPLYAKGFSCLLFVPPDPPWTVFHLYLDKPPVVHLASIDVFLEYSLLNPSRVVVGGVLTCPFRLKRVDISLISPLSVRSWRFCVALVLQTVVVCVSRFLVLVFSGRFPSFADLDAQLLLVDAMEWSTMERYGVHLWLDTLQLNVYYGLQMMGYKPLMTFGLTSALVYVKYVCFLVAVCNGGSPPL